MAIDVVAIAQGAVTILGPFMPYLVPLGKSVGKKLEEVIAENGGDFAWNQAQKLWAKINDRLKDDPVVTAQATMVSDDPEDSTRQQLLTQVLTNRLQKNPDLAEQLQADMGGETSVLKIVGGRKAEIRNNLQEVAQGGRAEMQGGEEAVLEGNTQRGGFAAPSGRSSTPSGDESR